MKLLKLPSLHESTLLAGASTLLTLSQPAFCGTQNSPSGKPSQASTSVTAATANVSQNLTHAQEKDKVVSLYEQNQYQAAAEFFETEAAHSTATVTYYAVLANLRCNRSIRAKQLAHYVLTRYPGTTEASLCQAVLRASGENVDTEKSKDASAIEKAGDVTASSKSGKSLKTGDAPSTDASAKTSGTRKSNEIASASSSSSSSTAPPNITSGSTSASKSNSSSADAKQQKTGASAERVQYPHQLFTADDIAKVGASGVDQTSNPNCWFESSLAALAMLPRGQRMIAQMITQVDPQSYVVKFPNDGNEYKIDKAELTASKIHDTALWAGLIDCAESRRYPHNQNMGSEKSWVETALGCVTGGRVEVVGVASLSPAELSSFIGGAVSSKNPIVCSTKWEHNLPDIVFCGHAYTITEFDPAKQMITLRNPHGRYSKSFSRLPDDPQELHFKQLKGGFSQMDIETFQKYFTTVGRSFI